MAFSDDEIHANEINDEIEINKIFNKASKEISERYKKENNNKKKKDQKTYVIDYIKFKDFIKIHNFRDSYPTKTSIEDNDTKIIRIYYGEIIDENPFRDSTEWFEFGIYDFGSTKQLINALELIFSKNILNSYVNSFSVNNESNILEVWITKETGDEYDY